MKNNPCKKCPYSAVCLDPANGWQHTFALLLWRACVDAGVFSARMNALTDVQLALIKRHWKKELLPKHCPHTNDSIDVHLQKSEAAGEMNMHLVFSK